MIPVQECRQCHARWPVSQTADGLAPARWCPRCDGPLSAPFEDRAPAGSGARSESSARAGMLRMPPTRQGRPGDPTGRRPAWRPPGERTYRWVARAPSAAAARVRPPQPRRRTPTPAYDRAPAWGLEDLPPQPDEARPSRVERWSDGARSALWWVVGLYVAAGLAEFFRYALLLRNRSALISPVTLSISDALVWVLGYVAPLSALVAAIGCVAWLIGERRRVYALSGESDPRRPWRLVLGCVVPVANLVWPGVYLTEMSRHAKDSEPSPLPMVRLWWGLWLLSGAFMVGNLLWRLGSSFQAMANGVLWTGIGDLVAAAVAWAAVATMVRFARLGMAPRSVPARRWVVAVDS